MVEFGIGLNLLLNSLNGFIVKVGSMPWAGDATIEMALFRQSSGQSRLIRSRSDNWLVTVILKADRATTFSACCKLQQAVLLTMTGVSKEMAVVIS